MGQNFAESCAFSSIIDPMISAFSCRTSLRISAIYASKFFFFASASGDFCALLAVAAAAGAVVCAPLCGASIAATAITIANNHRFSLFISPFLLSSLTPHRESPSLRLLHPHVIRRQNLRIRQLCFYPDPLQPAFLFRHRQEHKVILVTQTLL